jgi:hypothetical protein
MQNNERLVGILAARNYLLSLRPCKMQVVVLAELGDDVAHPASLYGMPALEPKLSPTRVVLKNALDRPLPVLSL